MDNVTRSLRINSGAIQETHSHLLAVEKAVGRLEARMLSLTLEVDELRHGEKAAKKCAVCGKEFGSQ